MLEDAPACAIGNYRIVRPLGEGGMGMVFEAEQQSPRRNVALKLIRSGRYASPRMRRMFEREAEALGRLRHAGIATIYEAGAADDGQPYLAMELVPGQPLDAWLKQQPPLPSLGKEEAAPRLRIFAAVCEAVVYAHQNGVIHRDLKPSNIFVAGAAGSEIVKILDFGLARMVDAAAQENEQTEAGVVQGSVPYMSPEQARGEADRIDTRSDVYSLGVILYWLLTSRHPYLDGPVGLVEGFQAVCTKPPAPFRQHYERFDADLETIAGKALEKDPARRYQTAAALLGDIESYLADLPIAARPPSFAYQARKLIQRHRVGFAAAAALVLLLVAFTVITVIQSARLRTERDRANQEAATARQVSDFLVELFRNTDPTKQPGADLSARDLLRAGRQRLDKDLQTQPSLRARLLDQIGHAYNELGPFSEARRAFEESLAIRRKLSGPDAVELAEAYSGLNVAFHALGDFKQAIQSEREALRLLERRPAGESTQPLAASLGRLAVSLAAQGELAEAERTARRAVELDREAGRSGKVEGLHRLESLGSVLRLKEDYAAAIPVLREAAEGIERAEGEAAAGGCMNELGIALNRVGQEKEGERVFRRLDAIVAKGWGETNLNRASIKSNLAFSLLAQKRLAEAEAAAREALEVHVKNGGDNPRRADVHNALAQVAEAQGQMDRALAEWRTAYRIALAGFGAEQYRTRMVAIQLGRLLALTGSHAEGLSLIRGNIEALRENRKDTLDWGVIQRLHGEALQAAGQRDQARRVLDDSLRLLLARAGPDHPEVRRTRLALGLAIEQPAKRSPEK